MTQVQLDNIWNSLKSNNPKPSRGSANAVILVDDEHEQVISVRISESQTEEYRRIPGGEWVKC